MSTSFRENKLLDRVNETNYIYNDIVSAHENKIMIIWSDSGIGKSSLTDKVFSKKYENKIIIKVNTPPVNANEMVVAGQYISYIALSFDMELSSHNFSMKKYLLSGYNERKNLREASRIISGICKLPFELLNIISDKLLGTNDMDADYILNSTDTESILINEKYIEMALNKFNIILNISNMQNIDSLSLSILNDILQKSNNNYYIFEFTTTDQNTTPLYRLYQRLNETVPTELMQLDNLPFEEVITLVHDKTSISSSNLLNYYLETIKGNLFKLQNLNICKNSSDILKYNYDPTSEIISRLSKASKMWIYIIVLHEGCIALDLFMHIINYIREQIYFNDSVIWSEINCLIEKNENEIRLKHASISDSMLSIHISNVFAVYELLCKYYSDILKNEEFIYCSKKDAILKIIKLYSDYSPENIINYLGFLRNLLISSVSQEQVSSIVQKVYSSITESEDDLKFYIISLCYSVGLYKDAYDFLEKISKQTETYIALKCALLNRLDRHNEFLELHNKYIYNKNISVRLSLIMNIFYILSNKSLARITECQSMFDKIKSTKKYHHIYEYGFFLRNSQILLKYSDSIPFVEESVAFFVKRNATDDADNSRLTLAVQYARLGNISQANELINGIRNRLLTKTFEKHIIYNDESAIKLLSGNTDETVFLSLEKAFITAVTNFDKLSILNNQICWLIDNKIVDSRFLNIKNKILNLLNDEPDRRLHKRSYINISQYYYIVLNDVQNQQYYLNNAKVIRIKGDDLNTAFIDQDSTEGDLLFQIQKNYLVSFIIYWHFDLPML